MTIISMKALLESGVHFGHRTHKWHPAMKRIFSPNETASILLTCKRRQSLQQAYNVVRDTTRTRLVLFVGTKRQAQETIQKSRPPGMPYVTVRWLVHADNWRTIRARVND